MKAEEFIKLIELGRFDKISNNGLELIAKRFRELEKEAQQSKQVSEYKLLIGFVNWFNKNDKTQSILNERVNEYIKQLTKKD